MNRIKLILIISIVMFVQGCSHMNARSPGMLETVDSLVEQERYGQAQVILARVPETHDDYSKVSALIAEIDRQTVLYEQQVRDKGGELEKSGEWHRAKQYYQAALANVPDSEKIKSAYQALSLKQGDRIEKLELELLMLEAKWLRDTVSIESELALISPGGWLKENRWKWNKEVSRKTARSLVHYSEEALELGELGRAEKLLNLAWQLDPMPKIDELKALLVKQQKVAAAQQQQAMNERLQSQAENERKQQQVIVESRKRMRAILNASLHKALDNHELVKALDYVTRLKLLGALNESEELLAQKLALQLDQQVQKNIDQGVEHYGVGQYKKAIEAWEAVLVLDPNNEQALEHIERAERVLEKLQRLRDSKKESANDLK